MQSVPRTVDVMDIKEEVDSIPPKRLAHNLDVTLLSVHMCRTSVLLMLTDLTGATRPP